MNKQIMEMALDIHSASHLPLELCGALATDLVEMGYRKQSEVIDDFEKRLLDAFPEPHRGGNLCPAIYYDDYREIIEECGARMKGEGK